MTAILLLAAIASGLRVGIPLYRREVAKRYIGSLGAAYSCDFQCPRWLVEGTLPGEFRYEFLWFLTHSVAEADLSGSPLSESEKRRLSSVLASLDSLVYLQLTGKNLSDIDLDFLPRLVKLRELDLSQNPISDRTIDLVIQLPLLEKLNLDGTQVSDNGLAKLSKLKALRNLSLSQTSTSDGAIARLQEAIPGLQVTDD